MKISVAYWSGEVLLTWKNIFILKHHIDIGNHLLLQLTRSKEVFYENLNEQNVRYKAIIEA